MSNSSSSSGSASGIGFPALLGLLFIGLKLGHVIDWEWLWVLSPFWLTAAFAVIIVVLLGVVASIIAVAGGKK